jgi:hypothetical protein
MTNYGRESLENVKRNLRTLRKINYAKHGDREVGDILLHTLTIIESMKNEDKDHGQ